MKITRQRLLVLRSFLSSTEPVSAPQLHNTIKQEDLTTSFTTVYRTLKAIVACGIAREIADPRGTTLYEHAYTECAHRHVVCKDCGAIIDRDA